MTTLVQFRSVVSTDKTWTHAVSRKLPSKALLSVRMAARQPRPTGATMASREQHLQEMTDVSRFSKSNLLQRGKLLERTEESSASERREFLVSSLFLSFISGLAWTSTAAAAAPAQDTTEVPLEVYSDSKDGFTLMRPTPWNKVDKPGASIFFEDPESRSNNIGVTVAPVRIASLDGFGTVDDIVKKLVKAERDKPSTKDIQVVGVLKKKLRDNTPLYSLEYTLDTTRGSKRVLTSVTVAGYKLYILNIIFADGPVAPASRGLNDVLHEVLNSFELLA